LPSGTSSADRRPIVTLRLPTSARPNEISDSKDSRQLALAVRSLALLRVPASAA
jgi:hypothetical protein